MANGIDLRVKETQFEVEALIQTLKGVSTEIINISNASKTIGQNLKNVRKPSDLVQSNAEVEKQLSSLQKKLEAHEKTIEALRKKSVNDIDKQRLAEIKLQKDRESAFDKYERQLQRTTGLYNNVQQRINELSREYNNLSIKRELGRKLTAYEEIQLGKLEGRINTYQNALKKVDGNIGKFQRNVGNYGSQWNGLGNAINQVTREGSAFVYSMQTGFLAISNNLPTLFDEISRIKDGIKQMNAEGKQTPSLFQQLAKSIFSFQTLLSLGVTLLTIYGAEVIEWASSLWDADKALESLADKQTKVNKAIMEGRRENRTTIENTRNIIAVLNSETSSYDLKLKKAKELIELYPKLFKGMTSEQLLIQGTTGRMRELNKALQAQTDIQSLNKLIEEASKERIDILQRLKTASDNYNESLTKQYRIDNGVRGLAEKQNALLEIRRKISDEEIAKSQDIEILRTRLIGLQEKTLILEKENTQETKENTNAKRENAVAINLQSQSTDSLLSKLEAQKKMFEEMRQANSSNNKEYKYWTELINASQASIDLITDPSKVIKAGEGWDKSLKQMANGIKTVSEASKKGEDAISSYLGKFKDDFLSQSGFTSLLDIMNDKVPEFGKNWKTTLVAVSEVAQDAFGFMDTLNEQKYQSDLRNLDLMQQNAMTFASTEEAKAEINRQIEAEKRELNIKRAKQQRDMARFNIITDLAQSLISVWVNPGFPTAIALSALLAGVGAAQLSAVNNAPIPAFKDGVRNFDGGMAFVGDGGVSEIIRTKNGELFKTPSTDTLVNLPKGADVFKSEKDYILNSGMNIENNQNINALNAEQMDGIMMKYFNNITVNETTFDKNGFNMAIVRNGQRQKFMNNRQSYKGTKFN